jgi:hypothetical protein
MDWDLIQVGGGSGLVANLAAAGAMTVNLAGPQTVGGFYGPTHWKIMDAGAHTGFASNQFTVNATQFLPPQAAGGSYAVRMTSGDLFVDFTPFTNVTDVSVSISTSTNFALLGESINYTVTVSNLSSQMTGLLTTTSLVSGTLSVSSLAPANGFIIDDHTLVWYLGGLAGGASTTLTFSAQPILNFITQQISTVTVSVTPYVQDPVMANNTASVGVTTVGIPLLSPLGFVIIGLVIVWAFYRRERQCAAVRS